MKQKPHVLVIDDSVEDVKAVARTLNDLGVQTPTVFTDVKLAILYLDEVVAGEKGCPDLVLLDLDFGMDSGFEVLRFYKTYPKMRECKIVVWTAMGETQQELCRLFGIKNVISKHQGEAPLLEVLSKALRPFSQSAGSP